MDVKFRHRSTFFSRINFQRINFQRGTHLHVVQLTRGVSDPHAVRIFYLCYCFRLTFARAPREYPSSPRISERIYARADGSARVPAGFIMANAPRESDPVCERAYMHACILIRGNARMQLPTSFPVSALHPPARAAIVHIITAREGAIINCI